MALTERYVTTGAAGGGDGSSGDPWTLDEAAANAVAGDRVNIQAGSYVRSTTFSPANDGARDNPVVWRGYTNTPGDATAPVVTLDASGNGIRVVDCAKPYHRFEYLSVTGNASGGPSAWGFWMSGEHNVLWRCRAFATKKGMNFPGTGCVVAGCEVALWAVGVGIELQGDNTLAIGCHVHGGPTGFGFTGASTGGAFYCVARSCSGPGFWFATAGRELAKLVAHCVSYGNTTDGVSSIGVPEGSPVVILNSILAGNGGFGVATSTMSKAHMTLCGVAFEGNSSGDVSPDVTVFEPVARISLAGNPFIDADAGDLRLRADAVALLGSGFPDAMLDGGVLSAWRGFPDIGAFPQITRPAINPIAGGNL